MRFGGEVDYKATLTLAGTIFLVHGTSVDRSFVSFRLPHKVHRMGFRAETIVFVRRNHFLEFHKLVSDRSHWTVEVTNYPWQSSCRICPIKDIKLSKLFFFQRNDDWIFQLCSEKSCKTIELRKTKGLDWSFSWGGVDIEIQCWDLTLNEFEKLLRMHLVNLPQNTCTWRDVTFASFLPSLANTFRGLNVCQGLEVEFLTNVLAKDVVTWDFVPSHIL